MKRKRIVIIPLLIAVLLLPLLAGCGKKEDAQKIDAPATLNKLLNDVSYDTELNEVEKDAALYFPGLPDNSEIKLYTGNGYFSDELAMVTLQDASVSKDVVKVIEKHLEELRNQYQNYIPEEVPKIDNAIICPVDKYVFLCVTSDTKTASTILSKPQASTGASTDASADTTDASVPETSIPKPTTESMPESKDQFPQLASTSGTYHSYGSMILRVDDKAFENYGYIDSSAEEYAKLVNKAADSLKGKAKVYSLVIPTAIGVVFPDDLAPKFPDATNQAPAIQSIFDKMSENVIPVNCYSNLLKHRDEYLYFHTDYHWNGRGAYYAYESFCNTKGIQPIGLDQRTEKQFPGFLGALYWNGSSKDPVLANNPDTVYAYCPKSPNASMNYTDVKGQTYPWNIITDVSQWDSGSKYSTFAAGDNPIAVFSNPDVKDNSVCVIVKDSYGNALLPYLADHYNTIYELDFRYWEGNLISFCQEKGAQDLIFANNLSMIGSNYLIGKLSGILG